MFMILYYIILYYIILYYVILHCIVMYCIIVLYYVYTTITITTLLPYHLSIYVFRAREYLLNGGVGGCIFQGTQSCYVTPPPLPPPPSPPPLFSPTPLFPSMCSEQDSILLNGVGVCIFHCTQIFCSELLNYFMLCVQSKTVFC